MAQHRLEQDGGKNVMIYGCDLQYSPNKSCRGNGDRNWQDVTVGGLRATSK